MRRGPVDFDASSTQEPESWSESWSESRPALARVNGDAPRSAPDICNNSGTLRFDVRNVRVV